MFPKSIHTFCNVTALFFSHQPTHNNGKVTKGFVEMFASVLKILKSEILYVQESSFARIVKIYLRSILFPLIILEMFLHLDFSPSVVN